MTRRPLADPGPRRRHAERQVGETYADALNRVAGERDAALRDVARLEAQLAATGPGAPTTDRTDPA